MPTTLMFAALALAVQTAGPAPHYRLTVRVDPNAHTIAVQGRLERRACNEGHRLYLNQGFRIKSFRVGGKAAAVRFDTAAPPAQWTDVTRPLVFDCRPGPIEFSYSGTIADTIAGVNLVAPGLVELALYSGWYPFDPGVSAFTYDLELNLPAGWLVASGGRLTSSRVSGDRQRLRFASANPGMDLAFVASPELVVRHVGEKSAPVEVYSARADTSLAIGASRRLERAVALYGTWYGQPRAGKDPLPSRLVFSPRGGWGYSRLPLILIPAGVARMWSRQPLGEAFILQGTAHELAHFWWQIADTKTPNDWINEGLAEFSAYSATGELFGPEVRDSLAVQYRRAITRAKTKAPIAATTNDSPDRYVNHYQKPALLFASVEASVGAERFHRFLANYYGAHVGPRDATTASFLDAARTELGADATSRLEQCLTGAWAEACAQ